MAGENHLTEQYGGLLWWCANSNFNPNTRAELAIEAEVV